MNEAILPIISTRALWLTLYLYVWRGLWQMVTDWVLRPGEKLLSSQVEIGDSYAAAEEVRKQHEQLEMKCTVCGVWLGQALSVRGGDIRMTLQI